MEITLFCYTESCKKRHRKSTAIRNRQKRIDIPIRRCYSVTNKEQEKKCRRLSFRSNGFAGHFNRKNVQESDLTASQGRRSKAPVSVIEFLQRIITGTDAFRAVPVWQSLFRAGSAQQLRIRSFLRDKPGGRPHGWTSLLVQICGHPTGNGQRAAYMP